MTTSLDYESWLDQWQAIASKLLDAIWDLEEQLSLRWGEPDATSQMAWLQTYAGLDDVEISWLEELR